MGDGYEGRVTLSKIRLAPGEGGEGLGVASGRLDVHVQPLLFEELLFLGYVETNI
jgi:hypothetical protein